VGRKKWGGEWVDAESGKRTLWREGEGKEGREGVGGARCGCRVGEEGWVGQGAREK